MSTTSTNQSNLSPSSSLPGEYPKEFDVMATQIQTHEKSVVSLHGLLEAMKANGSHFTDADMNVVGHKMKHLQTAIQSLKAELSRKIDIYENQIKGLEQAMTARKAVLDAQDSETGVLKDHPDILEYFVNSHAKLEQALENSKKSYSE
jgi:hypothetical protein